MKCVRICVWTIVMLAIIIDAKKLDSALKVSNVFRSLMEMLYNGYQVTNTEVALNKQNKYYQSLVNNNMFYKRNFKFPHEEIPLINKLHLMRKLIVLPLKLEDYNKYDMNYNYLNADKCILPKSLNKYLINNKIGMKLHFENVMLLY